VVIVSANGIEDRGFDHSRVVVRTLYIAMLFFVTLVALLLCMYIWVLKVPIFSKKPLPNIFPSGIRSHTHLLGHSGIGNKLVLPAAFLSLQVQNWFIKSTPELRQLAEDADHREQAAREGHALGGHRRRYYDRAQCYKSFVLALYFPTNQGDQIGPIFKAMSD
jgi:hypothetical protein